MKQFFPNIKLHNILMIALILIGCVFTLIFFLSRPNVNKVTVDKVKEMQTAGDLPGLKNILLDKKQYVSKDVRRAAIRAIVEIDTYEGDVCLNKMALENKNTNDKVDYDLARDIVEIRREVLKEKLKKDSNYVTNKIWKYMDITGTKSNELHHLDVYRELQRTFSGLNYEQEIDHAVATNILSKIHIYDEAERRKNEGKFWIEYINKEFNRSDYYRDSIGTYLKKADEITRLQNRYDSIDNIIKNNLEEQKSIQKYFSPQATSFRDNVVRDMIQKIYRTQGLEAALAYNQTVAKEHEEKRARYYEIFEENKQLKNEKIYIPTKQKNIRVELFDILKKLHDEGVKNYSEMIYKRTGKKISSPNSNAEHIGGKSDSPNNESASTVTEDNKFSYVKDVIKYYLKRDVFLVSARQKVDKGVNITSYKVKENEKKYESFVTTYEKDGVIWQIVSRDLGGFVVWCREEKVYRSVAFLPNQDGSTNHSYDMYLENALDLAFGRKIVHPLADD